MDTATDTATDTVENPTIAQIVAKFNELRAKYYNPKGYMVTTIPDSIAHEFIDANPESIWNHKYNPYASDKVQILCANIVVEVFGRKFNLRLDRPSIPEHRCEFETYFGFGGHCKGYTDKRIIACFPCQPENNNELDAAELLTASAEGNGIDEAYIKRALALLVLGGYVKLWGAYYEFSDWFASFNTFPGADVRVKDIILPYIFEHMVVACSESDNATEI